MITNPEIIKQFMDKQSNTADRTVPVVCQINDKYYCSQHIKHDDYLFGISDFKFEVPGLGSIVVPRINRFQFFFQKTRNQQRINPGHGYMYFNLPFEKVIEESDLDDFCLLLYQKAEDFSVTAYIYKDFDLLHKISNIDYIRYDKYNFDPNNFRIMRNGKLWFMLDGTEIQACDLSCSFEEWCNLFGEHLLLSQYALQNIDATDIQWNSKEIVTWQCNRGHTWKKSIFDYTNQPQTNAQCALCKSESQYRSQQYHNFLMKTSALSISDKQILQYYNTSNIEEAYRLATNDLSVIFSLAKSDKIWNERTPDWPLSVKFLFPFPNGTHGDIDMFLAKEYGTVEHIEGLIYEGEISTDYCNEILLLSESTGVNGGLVFDAIQSSSKVAQFEFVLPSLYRFLHLSNTKFALYKQQHIVTILENKIGNSNVYFQGQNEILRQYRAKIRKQRRDVYATLASSGKTSSKWKSEQQAYAIIKSIYPDAIYQYKPDWLGYQSLDIFIPSLSVGIEYQGQQHFEVVSLFGGEERLQEQQQRDKKKRHLCAQNNVRLIEWKYNDPLTKEFIVSKINHTY